MNGTRLTNQGNFSFGNLWNSNDDWSLNADGSNVYIQNDSKNMVLGINDSDLMNITRDVSTGATGATVVPPKSLDTLTLMSTRGADSAHHHRGRTKIFPTVTSLITVTLQSFVENDDKQKWEKGEANQEGYFTLTNPSWEMVLTITPDQTLELLEGTVFLICLTYLAR